MAKTKAKSKAKKKDRRKRPPGNRGYGPRARDFTKRRTTPITDEEREKWKEKYGVPWVLTEEYKQNPNGRPPKFRTPQALWDGACDYFEYIDSNPSSRAEWKDHGLKKIPLRSPYTWDGLSLRLGAHTEYFRQFRNNLKKDDPDYAGFSWVIDKITVAIRDQKFEGAANGQLNANLIAYDLGYKKDIGIGALGGGGGGITVQVLDQEEVNKMDALVADVTARLAAIDEETGTLPESK